MVVLAVAYLTLLLITLHGPALMLPFLSDDYIFLVGRERGLFGSLVHAFTQIPTYFRPVGREIYFWVVGLVAGSNPLIFHLANLAVLVATLVLIVLIAHPLAGARAAFLAAGTYALFYPHRVQLGYVSCSQDLLATAFGCGAVALHQRRRSFAAAAFLFIGMLSKESLATLPLVVGVWELAGARGFRDRIVHAIRRTWPLAASLAAWVVLVPLLRHIFGWMRTQPGRIPLADVLSGFGDITTGYVTTLRTYVGLEQPWGKLAGSVPSAAAITACLSLAAGFPLVARMLEARRGGAAPAEPRPARKAREAGGQRTGEGTEGAAGSLLVLGLAWALIGAIPVAVVGIRFSSYYVSFAAVGFALAVGALLARASLAITVPAFAVLAALALAPNASMHFRVSETDRRPPPGVSMMNYTFLQIGAAYVRGFQPFLLAQHPPRGTTIYFSQPFGFGVMGTAGAMGPRWWLHDPGITFEFVRKADLKLRPGPRLFVRVETDPLRFAAMSETLVTSVIEGELALRNDPATARVALERALRHSVPGLHDNMRASIQQNLGIACDWLGDTLSARRYWLEVVRTSPVPAVPALVGLGVLEARMGRLESARSWLAQAAAAAPQDSLAQSYLKRVNQSLGR